MNKYLPEMQIEAPMPPHPKKYTPPESKTDEIMRLRGEKAELERRLAVNLETITLLNVKISERDQRLIDAGKELERKNDQISALHAKVARFHNLPCHVVHIGDDKTAEEMKKANP